ncbi:hypothetical protein ACPWT1_19655 [Ramlibacter sp. MMS24-I3-19]|uniref:hypothetical protein n=1 Tax=Ramlibacter sp. MMS24-I3-19 TaxID=3416606 RepID=UPI003D03757D
MRTRANALVLWTLVAGASGALTACGGGGGGSGSSTDSGSRSVSAPAPPTPPDARSGTYTMVAADAHEYSLALDFDATTYHVTGNGVDQSGAIQADGAAYDFLPGNASGVSGSPTTRFSYAASTVVGEFVLAGGTVPFIASRTFATSLPTSTLTFNMLGRTVDTAAGTADTTIQQGQVTADGRLLTCDDINVVEIRACPAASLTSGALSISGDVITAATSGGNIPFRLATVGTDTVFLRSSVSLGTTRRFIVGLPAASTFTAGTFAGGTTEPAWGSVTLGTTAFASTGVSPAGVTTTRTGTASPRGAVNSLASLLFVQTSTAGDFYATAGGQIGAVVAVRSSAFAPGFMALGMRQ